MASSASASTSTTSQSEKLAAATADLPARVRVHEIARRTGSTSKDVIAALAKNGVTATSASSSVDREVAQQVVGSLLGTSGRSSAARSSSSRSGKGRSGAKAPAATPTADGEQPDAGSAETTRPGRKAGATAKPSAAKSADGDGTTSDSASAEQDPAADDHDDDDSDGSDHSSRSRRRRRGGRGRRGGRSRRSDASGDSDEVTDETPSDTDESATDSDDQESDDESSNGSRRRRRRRKRPGSSDSANQQDDSSAVRAVKGSTRLEAKRQRRRDSRDSRRRPQILSESEFLARRESVERVMAVRQRGDLAQVALLEDGVLVEHFVSQHNNVSMIGNIYVGRVQNVLPSMEAAFVDIGKGRNAVLYAGEVNWDIAGLEGKERRIETALASGDTVLVQVSKDPVGHKGARLTTQISLPGRFLVFVPGGGATGISRKLPDSERKRLKKILDKIVPAEAGVIIRTAAEGVGEDELAADVERLQTMWQNISDGARKASDSGHAPKQVYAEPDTLIKVVRDLFNSDISRLLIDGADAWEALSTYVLDVAPELASRVSRYVGDKDVFAAYRIDEQITKALQRKVRLPSGGSLVIDRTEAMTVVDVNTGKFTGSGGNLEETVTRNNLEAAEEIVRQLRLRDIGGIIVVDFIDMVLESNRDLVLRRLTECLGRDRTRHQVAEVTSLGLVQMTRKRMGIGLVEAFSEPCATCSGRGVVLHDLPITHGEASAHDESSHSGRRGRRRSKNPDETAKFEPLVVDRVDTDAKPDPRGPKPPAHFRSETDESVTDGDAATSADVATDLTDTDKVPAADDATTAVAEDDVAQPVAARKRSTRSRRAVKKSPPAAEVTDDTGPAGDTNHSASGQSAHAATPPQEAQPAAQPRTRRRAAGRPAGAPTQAAAVVDIVLPATGTAAKDSAQK